MSSIFGDNYDDLNFQHEIHLIAVSETGRGKIQQWTDKQKPCWRGDHISPSYWITTLWRRTTQILKTDADPMTPSCLHLNFFLMVIYHVLNQQRLTGGKHSGVTDG